MTQRRPAMAPPRWLDRSHDELWLFCLTVIFLLYINLPFTAPDWTIAYPAMAEVAPRWFWTVLALAALGVRGWSRWHGRVVWSVVATYGAAVGFYFMAALSRLEADPRRILDWGSFALAVTLAVVQLVRVVEHERERE